MPFVTLSQPRLRLSRQEKRAVALFSLAAFLERAPLAFRPDRLLTLLPYGDDAYYLFTIAKNIALGRGPTADGTHITNGFQPLLTYLYVPLFWLSTRDAWLGVRFSFIVAGIISALTVWALAYAVRALEQETSPATERNGVERGWTTAARRVVSVPIAAAAIWTFSILIFLHTTNGLETGLYSLLLLLGIYFYARLRSRNDFLSTVWFGIILGFAVLARIDAAIFVAMICAFELFRGNWNNALIIGVLAFAISAPWWYFNLHSFGSLMPTSGQAENAWPDPPMENTHRTLQAITDIALTVVYAPNKITFPIRIAIACAVLGAITFGVYRLRLIAYIRSHAKMEILFPFAGFCLTIFIYYLFFFKAPHFIARYYQPLRILWILLLALSAPAVYKAYAKSKPPTKILTVIALCAALTFGIERYYDGCLRGKQASFFYEAGVFANEHPSEKIGMLQSGIAGFMAPNVINLDGKVNVEALRAHQAGQLGKYMRAEHIDYIVDWKEEADAAASIAQTDELSFDSVSMIGSIQVMKLRTPPDTPSQAPSF